ncbi:hypothetical protein H311_00177 [Anncaliia algerae PRA109]|nr:hypothetical protein H311_00177 [Anncaliia algerae PRA109]
MVFNIEKLSISIKLNLYDQRSIDSKHLVIVKIIKSYENYLNDKNEIRMALETMSAQLKYMYYLFKSEPRTLKEVLYNNVAILQYRCPIIKLYSILRRNYPC